MVKFAKFLLEKDKYINDAIELIALNSQRAAFIYDKKKIVGVVSEGDILKALINKKNLHTPVNKIMNKSPNFQQKIVLKKDFVRILEFIFTNLIAKELSKLYSS